MKENEVISLGRAARLVFGAAEPTRAQLEQIQVLLENGTIAGRRLGPPGREQWTTTPAAVATYLAQRSTATSAARTAPSKQRPEQQQPLVDVYQEILADYFLAMLFRRRHKKFTKWFQRSVILGQITALSLIALLCFNAMSLRSAARDTRHVAICQWLDEHENEYRVVKWLSLHPNPEGSGEIVGVRYIYFRAGRKAVETVRYFTVHDDKVTGVAMELPGV